MSNQGGHRPGAGRKPGPDPNAAHRVRRMIMLSEEEYRQAKMIGDGNISAGVRRAIIMANTSLPLTLEQLEMLNEKLYDLQDEGPPGEGWASDELKKLRDLTDKLLRKSK